MLDMMSMTSYQKLFWSDNFIKYNLKRVLVIADYDYMNRLFKIPNVCARVSSAKFGCIQIVHSEVEFWDACCSQMIDRTWFQTWISFQGVEWPNGWIGTSWGLAIWNFQWPIYWGTQATAEDLAPNLVEVNEPIRNGWSDLRLREAADWKYS